MEVFEDAGPASAEEPTIPERTDLPNLRLEINCIDFPLVCPWNYDQDSIDEVQPNNSPPEDSLPRPGVLSFLLAVASDRTMISCTNWTCCAALRGNMNQSSLCIFRLTL